ncbi:MAG TPA: serine/threonine-protein kinase PknK, partial [Herpetosiphonaceae bacterium]
MIEQRAYAISQQLHVGDHTVVYRGERTGDGRPVILKVLKTPHPAPPDIARLRHEYEVARRLDLPSVVRPLALEPFDQTMALVLEDFGGQSLDRLGGPADPGLVLRLAIGLADTLGQIHGRNVIHKDVKPANIIANLATGEIKLTDFGIASTLSRETPALFSPNRLEGTVAYMSPEQTGRMNRALDYRSDFYSLGVTLYQLLTGELPFQSADLMELIHSHIAREAPPARRADGALPPQVAAIVARLLAKTAEERYQSAFGLKADLEECERQWRETGAIAPFPLGRADLSERFQLPQRLYGRERELDGLLAAFERARSGRSELLLVAGSSGIGKSSLVHEIHKPVVRERGYFASGKFDRLERSIPYSALINAFRDLARQLLSEDEERLAGWRGRLLAALAPNSRLISDAVPEVALIVGEQPAPPELPPAEAQHRFAYVFHSFVQVFAQPEHPLVLFLDDLQWADSASLKLIEQLLADRAGRALLLIGAYRDNETGAGHPLLLTLDALKDAEAPVSSISLAPLALDDVARLAADTLHADPASVRPVAEAVFQKTAGSPFFINQMLQTLYERGALRADPGRLRWTWDEAELRGMQIADNVVELLAAKLRQLPPASGELLRHAACMGAGIDLQTLALLGDDPAATVAALWPALSDGFLTPLGDSYKLLDGADSASLRALLAVVQVELRFAHDRVQQAAYSLLEPAERAALHGRIGRLLLEHLPPSQREERIFDIANQLNFAADLIDDPAERELLARLNLRAGGKALASGAYAQAVDYLQAGLRLLPADCWERRPELARDLHAAAAQAAYLNRDFAEMERLIALGLAHAASLLEQVPLYEIRIQYHTSQNNMTQAVATAREVLGLLGVKLPAKPTLLHVAGGLAATRLKLARTSIDAIKRLPPMADPEKLAALRILMSAVDGAYIAAPNLFPLIVFRMVELSLRHGNAPQSPFAYAIFAILMGAVLGDTPGGYAFGRFAIELMDQLKADELRAKVYVSFNITIRHWTEHLHSTLAPSLEGYASGLATGDIEYACHNAMYYCAYLLFCGEPLPAVRERQAQYAEFMRAQRQQFHLDYTTVYQHVSASLMDPSPLEAPGAGIAAMLPRLLSDNNQTVLFCAYQALAQLHYLAGAPALAAEHAKIARRYEQSVLGSVNIAQNNFYHSLALLGQAHGAKPAERERLLWAVDGNQAK